MSADRKLFFGLDLGQPISRRGAVCVAGSVGAAAAARGLLSPLAVFADSTSGPQGENQAQVPYPDFAIRGGGAEGWFYTQASGETDPNVGYEIVDDGDAKMWSGFQRLGGVDVLGYPISFRFQSDGFWHQVTEKGVLQWNNGQVVLANVFQVMSGRGLDDWLEQQGIPRELKGDDGSNGDFARAKIARFACLTDDRIAAVYMRNPNPSKILAGEWDPAQFYGLPINRPVKMGPFVAQTFQRAAVISWRDAVAGGQPVGTDQLAAAGVLFKQAGLVPEEARKARLNRLGSGAGVNPSETEIVPPQLTLERVGPTVDTVAGGLIQTKKTPDAPIYTEMHPARLKNVQDLMTQYRPYRKEVEIIFLPVFEGSTYAGMRFNSGDDGFAVPLDLTPGAPGIGFKMARTKDEVSLKIYLSIRNQREVQLLQEASPETLEVTSQLFSYMVGQRIASDGGNPGFTIQEARNLGHGSPNLPAAFQLKR